MTKQEVAREAGKVSLERFLNKDSLRKLHDTPLERWGANEIRYARTIISFSVAAKYGKIGAFQSSDQSDLLEMLIKLFKHPRVNKYQEFLNEVERQKTIMESELKKSNDKTKLLAKPPRIPSVQELIYSTKKSVAQKIWEFFTKDRPITKDRPLVKTPKKTAKQILPVVEQSMRTKYTQ